MVNNKILRQIFLEELMFYTQLISYLCIVSSTVLDLCIFVFMFSIVDVLAHYEYKVGYCE